jgi:hypothetical protein
MKSQAGLFLLLVRVGNCLFLQQNNPTSTETGVFERWLGSHGVERSVLIQDDSHVGGGRGLIASRRLEPGEVAALVPSTATLRLDSGLYDENDDWAGVMALNLLREQERGPESYRYEYIALGLPKEAPGTPCRWSSRHRASLQNATFVEECRQNSFWRRNQTSAHDAASHSKSFMHMIDLVCSRTLRGRDGSRQMVPLIDMANHAPSEAGGGYFSVDDQGNVALVVGRRGVDEGEAVTMDYGARTVDDFLLHYGFVPHRCDSDSVQIDVGETSVGLSWRDCQGYRGHGDAQIRTACVNELLKFPSSLEEDVRFVEAMPKGVSEAVQSALSYRIAKKSLLAGLAGVHSYESL